MTDRDEIIRLRDRVHALEGAVSGLVNSQREFRRLVDGLRTTIRDTGDELRGSINAVKDEVSKMSRADEIAAAVAQAVRADRAKQFTVWQKVAGGVAGTLLVIPSAAFSAHLLAAWFGWS